MSGVQEEGVLSFLPEAAAENNLVQENDILSFFPEAENNEIESHLRPNIERVIVDGQWYQHECQNGKTIKIHDNPEKGLSFQIWPSSLILSTYAESLGTAFWKGKRVIELGSGCGLVGILVASLGAKVALTDLPQTMNGGSAETFPLIWGQTSIEDLEEKWQKIDIILAADVIYHRELFEPLLNTLHELGKANQDAKVILSHVRRWKSDKVFFNKAKKFFQIESINNVANKERSDQSLNTRGAPQILEMIWKDKRRR